MADPPVVDEEPVDHVHDRQNDEQLPEAGQKAPRAVDRVHADQHVGDIPRHADALEAQTVFPDGFVGRKAQLDAALLHVGVIEVNHAHRALADADRADKDQQHTKTQPLQKYLTDHFRFLLCLHFPSVLAPAAAAVSQLDISNQRGTKKPPQACPAPDRFFKGILAPPRILFKTENARSAPKFKENRRKPGSARPGSRAGAASVMPNRLYRAGGSRKGFGRRVRAWSRWRGGRRRPHPR